MEHEFSSRVYRVLSCMYLVKKCSKGSRFFLIFLLLLLQKLPIIKMSSAKNVLSITLIIVGKLLKEVRFLCSPPRTKQN